MPGRIVWNIAAPMIGLGAFLLGLGGFAAWNVHQQQQTSSELVIREVHGMLAIDALHMAMREIRYQTNLFLRTHEAPNLEAVATLHHETDRLLARAKGYARTPREQELIHLVESGYASFFAEFEPLAEGILAQQRAAPGPGDASLSADQTARLARLADEVLTEQVLEPLQECLQVNQQVVERTNEASQATAQHLKIGFLLLGICGGTAGLLLGTAIARAVGRSIVQLHVSVRGAVGRLADVTGPVTFSHTGDLQGLETGLRSLESEIAGVVERLQQREMEVLRSEQLARVGQLAAGLAHELRNPLMPMKMLVQAALERPEGAALSGRALQVLNDEIGRMEEAIQEFLDFARPPAPEKSAADLREVIAGTLELVAARARQQSVELRGPTPGSPCVLTIDATQIRHLLLNLLLNALDALPQGGWIRVTLGERVAPPETATQSGRWVAVQVRDNGAGILPEMLENLFEPFVTSKETGTGLGLSICQRIAAAHDGRLTVANHPQGGAEFTLLLPRET